MPPLLGGGVTRDLSALLLCLIFVGPLIVAASLGGEGKSEQVNRGLAAFLLYALPLFSGVLFFRKDPETEDSLVRFGADRRIAAQRRLLLRLAVLTLVTLLGSWLILLNLRGPRDPLLISDALSTSSVGLAAALSVGGTVFLLRAWGGIAGAGLFVVLLWVFAGLEQLLSAALPTGIVRSLLGMGEALPWPAWILFLALYAVAAGACFLGLLRTPR